MSRIVKKYSHKYEFLKLELEDYQEEFEDYEIEWKKLFGKYFTNIKTEMWVNEETGEMRDTPPDIEEKKEKTKKNDKVKKLYRKTSTLAHPDKGGNEEDFNYIKKCYENNDLLGLILFAGEHNIEVEITEEDKALLDKSCLRLQNEITSLRSSLIYNFFTGNERMKKGVILQLQQQHNVEIDVKDILDQLDNRE